MAASRCAPPQRPRGLHRSRVGAAPCGCRGCCSWWLGRHFIDATWWFDFAAIQPSQRALALAVVQARELAGWIVRVMAKVDCPQPQIAILTVSDRIACTRHGHHDRAVLDGDPQLANEVVLLGPPYARREVSW